MAKGKKQGAKGSEQAFSYTQAGPVFVYKQNPAGFLEMTIQDPYTEDELREIVARGDSRLVGDENEEDIS